MSDVFMRNVLKDRACTEYILRTILEDGGLRVLEQVIQKDYKNLQGRSAILDCVAADSRGRQINIEVQQKTEGASPQRARYHSGLLDMNTLNPGQRFEELPESCVIFITLGDGLGYGCPIYHIKRKISEVNQDFRDGSYIIYVDSKNQEDTPLGRLMHDFHCSRASEMQSGILAKRVRELKETEEGAKTMCEEMDRIFREGRRLGEKHGEKRGERRGEMKSKRETAARLAKRGMTVPEIAELVGANTQLVQKWLENRIEVLK
ncbi:MAG TPA: PD-(D/E)XK nuclease family transposase [Candidatus Enterocloster excrementigallinarum]|uniref:PD-(D/E)XK nuclease family transposase n=1 Tax=Candidatus Enterocloster excrementigallinarum TaxID=2838558 RepID=A0A9D2TES9_9FIRM|nr:PD-(D/E)XK nuclease family transposase [Candidatus Enterocloster excrementigallinarum]